MADERNCCTGKCCEAFSLGQMSLEDDAFIADVLVPLGYFSRNPLHLVGHEDYEVQEVDPRSYRGAWFYTCKHYDKDTRSCTAYEKWLAMCRKFPNDGPCNFSGCAFRVPYKMRKSHRFPGLYTRERGDLSFADIELLAQALDCPEDPIYQAGKLIMEATDGEAAT